MAKHWGCYDCKNFNDQYMVRDAVWKSIIAKPAERKDLLLCLTCLQARLKRQLVAEDFDFTLPINSVMLYGFKMGQRAAHGA